MAGSLSLDHAVGGGDAAGLESLLNIFIFQVKKIKMATTK